MVQEVDPSPQLISYFQESKALWTDFDGNKKQFVDSKEWHYILSNIEQNIFLLKRLEERDLLKVENHIVDCGIGLGTALFDIYLQSKEFSDRTFTFTGIEKQAMYIGYLEEKLFPYWEGNLELIHDDIMNQDYSKFNIIYTFTPFQTVEKLKELYKNKDFGSYAENGKMPVAFLSNTDITGGNSGSPVINGDGELIGLAFDGNWEAMSGDIAFEPNLQRTISVDIRYVLFIIDKFAGAKNIINELVIKK